MQNSYRRPVGQVEHDIEIKRSRFITLIGRVTNEEEARAFIDAARTSGGHVLDYVVDKATVELCPASDLELRLPLTQEFSRANLSPEDLDSQLHTTEVKTKGDH